MFTGEEAIVVIEPPSQGIVGCIPQKKAHFFTLPLPFPTSLRNSWAGETRRALAELQEAQGHHEEARSGFERAWAVRTQVLGAAAPPTPEARQHLLALLRAIGQYEEVARLKAAQPEQGTSEAAPARLPEDEQREPPKASPESGQHLSENT